MPTAEEIVALWESDLEVSGWDPGPIPIITSAPESTWLWSDLHLSDPGPLQAFNRPFADVAAMNAELLDAWCRRVGADELLVNLGDVAHPDALRDEDLVAAIRKCPGQRVLVIGNHDETERAALAAAGFEAQCWLALTDTDPPLALSHAPLGYIPPGAVNVHGHLHAGTEPTPRHINLAVEKIGYAPIRLSEVLATARRW